MKKKLITLLLIASLAVTGMMSGCGNDAREKANDYKKLGITQMDEGKYEEALESFQNALDQSNGTVSEDEIDLCFYKALAQFKSGDMKAAIETYSGLITYDGKDWEAYYLRGCAYLKDGQGKKCLSDFNKAIELNSEDYELYSNIAQTLKSAGYGEQATKYLDKGLEMKDNKANAYALGYLYYMKEDYESARTYLEKACAAGKDKAYLLLGQVYMKLGSSDAAQASFDKYLEAFPDDVAAFNELGMIAMDESDYTAAVSFFQQAKASGSEGVKQTASRNLVAAYEAMLDFDGALKEAEEYLAEYDDEQMEREMKFLETRVTDEIYGDIPEDGENSTEDEGTEADDGQTDTESDAEAGQN